MRIVVDASIARAAGGDSSVAPVSKHCRHVLRAILEICHKVVMTNDIFREWRSHESSYARKWRLVMLGKKKVVFAGNPDVSAVGSRVDDLDVDNGSRRQIKKDLLLVVAAIATDRIILSMDNRSRRLFAENAVDIGGLGKIAWVNPNERHTDVLVWLDAGAELSDAQATVGD